MPCPYLEEVVMRYCQAYPLKKMIPASVSQLASACFADPASCAVFRDAEKIQAAAEAAVPTPKAAAAQPAPPRRQAEREQYCIWLREEVVSFRLCTRDYDCQSCQFEQTLFDQDGKYQELPHVVQEIERMRRLPGSQRRCKYMLVGKTLQTRCDLQYECWRCPTYQGIRSSIIEQCVAEAGAEGSVGLRQ